MKNAQEAHEAIRPAGETFRTPGQVATSINGDEFRLYELIWQRTIASQMVDARGLTLSLRITADADGRECVFGASGRTITFPGFLRAYVETVDAEAGGEADDAERRLPNLTVGQQLDIRELIPASHVTTPPARYTEPSLIKRAAGPRASAGRRPTRRSSGPSSTAATCGRRARRWCRRGSRSR